MALDHRVLVYNFADLRLIYQWETIHNGKGLLAMSSQVENTVVACPGVHVGQVRFCTLRMPRVKLSTIAFLQPLWSAQAVTPCFSPLVVLRFLPLA